MVIFAAVGELHPVHHAGGGGDQIQIVFPLQPLLDDLHVQQPQKAAAEAKAQGHRGLRLKGEGGVVELQLLQSVPQIGVVGAVRGVDAAEHHGLHRPVARQRFGGGAVRQGDGVAHTGLGAHP